jgi:hypothetical protein
MRASAESHAGINLDRDAARLRRFHPGGDDHQPPADGNRFVVLFPCFHPVLVCDLFVDRRGQGLDHAKKKKRLFEFLPRLFELVIDFQIGAHADRSHRDAFVFFIEKFDARAFGDDAVGSKARQNIRDRFGQFTIYEEGDFEPVCVGH